ncbi:hypothetical protein MTO96_010950 [Rhipicephalus appendiculatus]
MAGFTRHTLCQAAVTPPTPNGRRRRCEACRQRSREDRRAVAGIKERLIASHVPDGGIERAATFHTAHHRSPAAGLCEERNALGNEENEREGGRVYRGNDKLDREICDARLRSVCQALTRGPVATSAQSLFPAVTVAACYIIRL